MSDLRILSLLLAVFAAVASGEDPPPLPTLPPLPGSSGVFDPENVRAYIEYQDELFLTDCEKYTGTWADDQDIKYCGEGITDKCFTTKEEIEATCIFENQINANKVVPHGNVTIHPGSTPWPYYPNVAILGKTTFCHELEYDFGFGPVTPICYDYVTHKEFVESNSTADDFGLATILSYSFYTISIGTCPGYEPVICNPATADTTEDTMEVNQEDVELLSSMAQEPALSFVAAASHILVGVATTFMILFVGL